MIRPDRTPKSESPPRRRRRALVLLLALLLLLGWWLWPDGRLAKARGLRDELFSEAGRGLSPEDRRSKFEELRSVTGQMSEAQRRELSRDMLKRREDELRRYSELSSAEKKQQLDKDIRRQEERRQRSQSNGNSSGPSNGFGGPGRGGPSSSADPQRRRQERLDWTTPEFRELTDQYRRDVAARRQELGLPPAPPRRPPRTTN